jgi:BirA family transcriptional regulator, biotin operon repressor / biotin---[acetyl-CoA-carboxylase] ligase
MSQAFEALDRQKILARLSDVSLTWLRDLQIHAEIDSTNSHLLRLVDAGVDGLVCLAEHQTRGKGRRGRTWIGRPARGLALSLGRRTRRPLAELAPVGLVAGVAVAEALGRHKIPSVSLKWPNDVLVDGVKAGGILVEAAGAVAPQLVIGVGLNVGARAEIEDQLGHTVGDVLAADAGVSRNALAATIIDSLVSCLEAFETEGFAALRQKWEDLDAYRDRRVRIRSAGSDVVGVARGITATGELLLETESGIVEFNSGEVSLRV